MLPIILLVIIVTPILAQEALFPTFEQFVEEFNKTYANQAELNMRREIYNALIQELKQITDYTPRIYSWADETQEQRKKKTGLSEDENSKIKVSSTPFSLNSRVGKPVSLNWTAKGIVTSIKNQGSCGSCWAFATAAYAESKLIKEGKQNRNIDLSQQYLVSCTSSSSCEGGFLENAFSKLAEGGLPTQSSYPYNPYGAAYAFICWTWSKIRAGYDPMALYNATDDELEQLLNQRGPLGISISSEGWQSYGYGVFSCRPGNQVDHAVLLVGYTPDYWIVKNQWGQKWGEDGYIRVTKSRYRNANCRIGTSALWMREENLLKWITCLLIMMMLLV